MTSDRVELQVACRRRRAADRVDGAAERAGHSCGGHQRRDPEDVGQIHFGAVREQCFDRLGVVAERRDHQRRRCPRAACSRRNGRGRSHSGACASARDWGRRPSSAAGSTTSIAVALLGGRRFGRDAEVERVAAFERVHVHGDVERRAAGHVPRAWIRALVEQEHRDVEAAGC